MESSARVEQVEDVAVRWLARRNGGRWDAHDEAEFEQWIEADTGHWVAYTRLESVWRQTGRMKLLGESGAAGTAPARGELVRSPFLSRKALADKLSPSSVSRAYGSCGSARVGRMPALAAALLAAVGLGMGAYFWLSQGLVYRTAVGGISTVPLEDGSSITLNTHSEVRVSVEENVRRVRLTRGEAFFQVAKDPQRPFVVDTGDERILVLGTAFSVRVRPESVEIRMAEGAIRVMATSPFGRDRPLADLHLGQIAEVREGRIVVDEIPLMDIEQSLSWRSGYIALRGTRLDEAIAEFNRYHYKQLVIVDPALAGLRVGGNFRWDNLEGFLRILDEGFGVQARQRGSQIVLTRAPL